MDKIPTFIRFPEQSPIKSVCGARFVSQITLNHWNSQSSYFSLNLTLNLKDMSCYFSI